ncbi:MAG: polysaccharide deacetylase family protein [Thermoplasmata archaeon]
MRLRVVVTVDVERDYPNALEDRYLGITEGLPTLLDVFDEFEIRGDFFVSKDIADLFGQMIKNLGARGHFVGNHGAQHGYLCEMGFENQLRDIRESTQALSEVLSRPVMFRAPQFGADGKTVLALEDLGYRVDSSVLPGRSVKRGVFGKTLDFTNAPREVYHPSESDIAKEGHSSIVEIPLTENPFKRGTPIGMGYLNSEGHETVMDACKAHRGRYVTFLIHPWECIDILEPYPSLPKYLGRECSSDTSSLRRLLEELKGLGDFTNLMDIADEYIGGGSK